MQAFYALRISTLYNDQRSVIRWHSLSVKSEDFCNPQLLQAPNIAVAFGNNDLPHSMVIKD